MREFMVPIVLRENLNLWHDRWSKDPPTKASLEKDHDASLSQTYLAKAKNFAEAARKAEEANSGWVAIKDSIKPLDGA